MKSGDSPETNPNPDYRKLHKIGGIAAFIAAATILGEIVFLVFFPQPITVNGWFSLMHSNPVIGILDYWGLEILMYLMLIFLFLALYTVLQKTNPSLMLIVPAMALTGIGIFFATNNPFTMLSISHQFAAADTETQRVSFLAAGETVLAGTGQRAVNGFNTGLFLVSISGLLVSVVMRQSLQFSRATTWTGIAAYTFSLVDFFRQIFTSSTVITLLVVIPNALLLITWLVMVGKRLVRLGTIQ